MAKLAQESVVIKGILLYQRETNTGDEEWPNYVKTVYHNLLADLSFLKGFVFLNMDVWADFDVSNGSFFFILFYNGSALWNDVSDLVERMP
jgi:hypothetical protein